MTAPGSNYHRSVRSFLLALGVLPALVAGPVAAQMLDEARALHAAGDHRAALAAYAKAIAEAGTSDPATAATAHNNACVILNGFGEYAAARQECARAMALRRGLDDPRRLARTLNNLAIAQQNLGEYEAAGASFREALEINTRRDDALARVLNLSNLGALATLRGRYAEALGYHRRATDLAAAHAGEDWSAEQLQVATINRGVVLEHLGAHREALELYRDLIAAPPGEMSDLLLAQLKLNSGVVYRNLGDPVRAVAEFEAVTAIYERLEDPAGLSNALLNLALALDLNLERGDEAEEAYRRALALSSRSGSRPEEIRDLYHLGRFLARQGRLDEAEERFRQCLEAASQAGSARGRWAALAGLGGVAAARGELAAAADRFAASIEEIERAGADLPESALRSGYFDDQRPVYAEAAQVLADLHRSEPEADHDVAAFLVAQRAKARALLDSLGRRGWTAKPLPAVDVGDALRRPLVEYFAASRELLRWKIGPAGLEMRSLGDHEPTRDAALAVYRALETGAEPDAAALGSLAGTLLGGLGLDDLAAGSLHLAPADALERLPFEILPVPGRPGEVLADRFAVSYVPSASTLVWLRQRGQAVRAAGARSVGLRGFANPQPARDDPESARALIAARFSLGPLPAAARSLDALSRALGGSAELYVGADASEAVWSSTGVTPARVVHFAAHAVVDERPGRGAAILLTPGDGHDGLLEPREIAARGQRGVLTVLAACRSAVGDQTGGALSSLAGAFLAAGSSAVVATLWDVGDVATATFMGQFYHHLGRGREPAVALVEAKRALRADPRWARAHLWSAYVLIGEAPAVASPRSRGRLAVALVALLAGGALLARRLGRR